MKEICCKQQHFWTVACVSEGVCLMVMGSVCCMSNASLQAVLWPVWLDANVSSVCTT